MNLSSKLKLPHRLIQVILGVTLLLSLFFLITFLSFIDPQASLKHNINTEKAMLRSIYYSTIYSTNDQVFINYENRVATPDNMPQVMVPSGTFEMGEIEGKGSPNSPKHQVTLASYWIDAIEVTNQMYALCVKQQGCTPPAVENRFYINPFFKSYPIVYVTWEQAVSYCVWADRDLPTEAEWEKAARGSTANIYPWGNQPPDTSLGNFSNKVGTIVASKSYKDGISPYGALNMVSNVREWVKDWYNPTYYQRSQSVDPQGAKQGSMKALRGGSFLDTVDRLPVYFRFFHEPESPGINRGFRCVSRLQ